MPADAASVDSGMTPADGSAADALAPDASDAAMQGDSGAMDASTGTDAATGDAVLLDATAQGG
jgi:hypothetical protein